MVRIALTSLSLLLSLVMAMASGQDSGCEIDFLLEPGDANKDLWFDTDDLVQVMVADRFLKGGPATWEEGDWNGDGVFDDSDLVLALETGNYLQGPYAMIAGGPAPTTRGGAPAVWLIDPVDHPRMLCFGGMNPITNDSYTFDPVMGWLDITSNTAPAPRCHHTLVDDTRGSAILFGGFSRERRYNDAFRFDPLTSRWIQLDVFGEIPAPRCLHAAAVIPGRNEMLVYGGIQGTGGFGGDYFLDTSILDLETGKWKTVNNDSPPGGRAGAIAFYSSQEDGVFLWGGLQVRGTLQELPNIFTEYLNELWRYDPENRNWEIVAVTGEIPVGREDPTFFWDDTFGRLYLFHGKNKTRPFVDRLFSDAFVLHLSERRWERLATEGDRPPERWRGSTALDPITGEGWLFGGWTAEGQLNDTWRFDVTARRWMKVCITVE